MTTATGVAAEIESARERLAEARERLRTRDREETLETLAAVLDAFRDPGTGWQGRLVESLPAATGFSPETVREGLALGFADWSGDALRALVQREIGGLGARAVITGFDQTSVVLAGSIPMPSVLSLIAPLLLHSPVLAKTASRDPVTAGVLRECLEQTDPALASALEIVSFPSADDRAVSAFVDSDCVVATGSDQAIAAIARASRPGTRLVGYGHRCSVAVIGPEATDRTTAQALATALAQDVALWDQLGCLSPIAVLCLGGNPKQLARELADALRGCAERMPRGVLPAAAAAAIRSERDAAALRRAAGADVEVEGDEALSYTVVREPDAALRPSPLHRFVRVHPVEGLASLREVLSPLSQHLAGVAIAGFGAGRQAVERELASLGASRVCAPGRLQAPPFGWHHDNQPVLLPLLRVTDLETPA